MHALFWKKNGIFPRAWKKRGMQIKITVEKLRILCSLKASLVFMQRVLITRQKWIDRSRVILLWIFFLDNAVYQRNVHNGKGSRPLFFQCLSLSWLSYLRKIQSLSLFSMPLSPNYHIWEKFNLSRTHAKTSAVIGEPLDILFKANVGVWSVLFPQIVSCRQFFRWLTDH